MNLPESREDQELLALLLAEQIRRQQQRRFYRMFPDEDGLDLDGNPLVAREKYVKHLEFFRAGATYRERLAMFGNRVGKTVAGAYETTCHLTGLYPDWWQGRRFDQAVRWWAAGKTNETTRDIIQAELLGEAAHSGARKVMSGTGMIPGALIGAITWKQGTADLVDTVKVRHISGRWSMLGLKSYQQGRGAFEGTSQHGIWPDEEPPLDVYGECLIRTATTDGIIMMTFTPLEGMSETVLQFMPSNDADKSPSRFMVQAGWNDAPHLDEKTKRELLASTPPHLREARSEGIPSLGSGAIYPVPLGDIQVKPFAIPDYWPRAYGMDVGWKRTAVVWGAWDPGDWTLYLYAEHYRGQAEPPIHSAAVKARGEWIKGTIDPAAHGRQQADGEQLLALYRNNGLVLTPADNGVEAGLYACWQGLSTGRIKVFSTLGNFADEYRLYRRDENGKIVKDRDHLMDAFRYLVMSGRKVAQVRPAPQNLNGFVPIGDARAGY